jgi:hypothetical protein
VTALCLLLKGGYQLLFKNKLIGRTTISTAMHVLWPPRHLPFTSDEILVWVVRQVSTDPYWRLCLLLNGPVPPNSCEGKETEPINYIIIIIIIPTM